MPLSEEVQAQIDEAVRIVAEDRLWTAIQGRLAPTDPEPEPEPAPDDGKPGGPPPAKPEPDEKPAGRRSAWFGELDAEEAS